MTLSKEAQRLRYLLCDEAFETLWLNIASNIIYTRHVNSELDDHNYFILIPKEHILLYLFYYRNHSLAQFRHCIDIVCVDYLGSQSYSEYRFGLYYILYS